MNADFSKGWPKLPRDRVHAALRERGWSNDLDALIALLEGHKAKLQRVVELAETAKVDRVGQRILNSRAGRAKAFLRAIEGTLDRPIMSATHGDLGRWGHNGNAPQIDDLLSSAEFEARMGAVEAIPPARHVLTDRVVRAA